LDFAVVLISVKKMDRAYLHNLNYNTVYLSKSDNKTKEFY